MKPFSFYQFATKESLVQDPQSSLVPEPYMIGRIYGNITNVNADTDFPDPDINNTLILCKVTVEPMLRTSKDSWRYLNENQD